MPFNAAPTDQQQEEFLQLLRAGNHVKTACLYTGINERTLYGWMQESQRDNGRPWTKDFAAKVNQARAFAQASALQLIRQAGRNGDWKAEAWFLERSNPQHWALTTRHEVELTSVDAPTSSPRDRLSHVIDAISLDLEENEAEIIELPPASNGH